MAQQNPDQYDSRQLHTENAVFGHYLAGMVPAAARWLNAQGRGGKLGCFYSASLCYPGMPGPVTAAELWESGGGTVRAKVRAYVHDPDLVSALNLRGTMAQRRQTRPGSPLWVGRVVIGLLGMETGKISAIKKATAKKKEKIAVVLWSDGKTTDVRASALISAGTGRLRIV